MIFLSDENFPERAARLLEAFDDRNEIRHLTHSFDKGTPDTTWIPAAGLWTPKPAIVSGDGRILRNRAERAVLRESNLTFVLLSAGWPNLPWSEYAWKIVKIWPEVVRNVEQALRPTVFEIGPSSPKVTRVGETARL